MNRTIIKEIVQFYFKFPGLLQTCLQKISIIPKGEHDQPQITESSFSESTIIGHRPDTPDITEVLVQTAIYFAEITKENFLLKH